MRILVAVKCTPDPQPNRTLTDALVTRGDRDGDR